MLFNNPKSVVASQDGGDGTYLHEDIVLQRIVEKLTPPTVYANNKELLDAFSQTLVNFSPVSINIMDFWNKTQLSNIVMPLPDTDFDKINPDNLYEDSVQKGFFINSIKNLQERIAETYLNNFYTTAYKVRNSHTLRQKLYQIFNSFDIPMDDKNLLFNNINELFKEERYITAKDFNTQKGKKIALTYAALSAHDAEIEGPLTAQSFFLDYTENAPLSYTVESVILSDVYNAFVKPLAHPLGLNGDYLKICKTDITERVFNKIKMLADGVSIKCTHPSDTLPTTPPPVLLPFIINPAYIDEETTPEEPKRIPELPYESAIQNTEQINVDDTLTGPWDPANPTPTPEMYYATTDGNNLWSEIAEIDNGQGNILEDIQYGYGDEEYAGMSYTKYIFENKSYVIEYTCKLSDGSVKRIVEYYRYDLFDTSIHDNTIAKDGSLDADLYPAQAGQDINIVHGKMADDFYSDGPIKTQEIFSTEDGLIETGGLDAGVFTGTPGTTSDTLPFNYPNEDLPRVILQTPVDEDSHVTLVTHGSRSNRIDIYSTSEQDIFDANFDTSNVSVWINGIKLKSTEFTSINTDRIELTYAVNEGDRIEIIDNGSVNLIDFDTILNQTIFPITINSFKAVIFLDGIKINDDKYEIVDETIEEEIDGNIVTTVVATNVVLIESYPENTWLQIAELDADTDSDMQLAEAEQDTFYFKYPPYNQVDIFIDGIKISGTKFEIINTNEWFVPGTYAWEKNTNIINTEPQFTAIYSLGARYISTRKCIVNVYNLHESGDTSIAEEFAVTIVKHQKNIIHEDETINTNIINIDDNVVNKYQQSEINK